MKKVLPVLLKSLNTTGIKFRIFVAILISNTVLLLGLGLSKGQTEPASSPLPEPQDGFIRYHLPLKLLLKPKQGQIEIPILLSNTEGKILSRNSVLYFRPIWDDNENSELYPVDLPSEDGLKILKTSSQIFIAHPSGLSQSPKKKTSYEIIF